MSLFSEEEDAFRASVEEFALEVIEPKVRYIDQENEIPQEIYEKVGKAYFGVPFDPKYGGQGKGILSHCIVTETLARFSAAVSMSRNATIYSGIPIEIYGTYEQKEKYLRPICEGKTLGSICITEPEAGSDTARMETKAFLEGDEWVINGKKRFITNGGLGQSTLWAITNPNADRPQNGMSCFIIPKGTKGFEVEKRHDLMGMRGVYNCQLKLKDVRIPKENLIGKENEGFQILMRMFVSERATACAEATGLMVGAINATKDYVKKRVQFKKPIGKFQGVRFQLTDMITTCYAARLMMVTLCRRIDAGEVPFKEAAMSKLFAAKEGFNVISQALNICGGDGYTKEYPIERYLRDMKLMEIGGGTNNIQRLIIAREELGR